MAWLKKSDSSHVIDAPPLHALWRLAFPMLIGAVLQNIQSLIDLYWVGKLPGKESIVAQASVTMAGTALMVLFPMLMGITTGTVALVSRAIGEGRPDHASKATSQSLLLAFVLGGLTALCGWFFSDSLLKLLGAESDVIVTGGAFLRISLYGSFTVYILFIGNSALQGAGDAMTPMVIMAASNVFNLILAPFFIFGNRFLASTHISDWWPLPAMGVTGAAWAMVLSQALAAAISVRILFGGKAHIHVRFKDWVPNIELAWRILRVGIPGAGQMLARSLMGAVMLKIVTETSTASVVPLSAIALEKMKTATIAAYGTGMRFHMIILMPAFALGGAAATMVGQNLGAGKPDRARKAAWLATGIDVVLMAATAGLMAIFAPQMIRAFNTDADIIRIGTDYLRIVSPFYIFAALGIVLGRALNGAGDSVSPMVTTVVALWGLQVPLAIFLSRIWNPAIHGIWWAMVISMIVQGIAMTLWFETGRWKKTRV